MEHLVSFLLDNITINTIQKDFNIDVRDGHLGKHVFYHVLTNRLSHRASYKNMVMCNYY